MLDVVRFWLDLGLDGFRLDAVPYLFERDGTNGENLTRDPRLPQDGPRGGRQPSSPARCCWPRPTSGPRTSWSTSATATSATCASTSRSCRACSCRCAARRARRSTEILQRIPGHPRGLPVGHLPAQPRRADARDGHRRRARLHVLRVRAGPAHARNVGIRRRLFPLIDNDRAPGGAAARVAVLAAGYPDPVLRRRDRHGRQHLPRRPGRRAHADAVDPRSQRRLLARGLRAAVPAAAHGSGATGSGGERRGRAADPVEPVPALAAALHLAAQGAPASSASARYEPLAPSNTKMFAHIRALRGRASRSACTTSRGSAQPVELDLSAYRGPHARGDVRPHRVPARRRAAVLRHARAPSASSGSSWRTVMPTEADLIRSIDDDALSDWIVGQRWFASKARDVTIGLVEVLVLDEDPPLGLALVEARFAAGTHDLYQLLVGPGDPRGDDDAGARPCARAAADRRGARSRASTAVIAFHWSGEPLAAENVRLMGAEQSNTSIVIDESAVLKVFRRFEAGDNPELEMVRFLTSRGFENVPALRGWYALEGELLDATLGVAQELVQRRPRRLGHGARDPRDGPGARARRPRRARRGHRADAHRPGIGHHRPGLLARRPGRGGPRAPHRDDRRGDRTRLPRPARRRRGARPDRRPRRGDPRSPAAHVARRRRRRSSSATTATCTSARRCARRTAGSSSTSRASPRARSSSGAASARRCATSPGCCGRSPTPPRRRAS